MLHRKLRNYSNTLIGIVRGNISFRYKAPTMELEAKLRPFIPEYIPAIGEVDAFLKMPRPDP